MPPVVTASELVKRVLESNTKRRRYADFGYVRELRGRRRKVVTFRTDFLRPNWFRFQFESPHPYKPLRHTASRTVIGNDADGPYFWSSNYGNTPTLEREESLLLAVAGATGISRGSAHSIATLLLPSTGPSLIERLRRIKLLPAVTVHGTKCIGFIGRHVAAGRVSVYVAADDMSLRKVVHHRFKHVELRRPLPFRQSAPTARFAAP